MRAGSLGDARAVALLQDFFVPVQVSELSTVELIAEPADVDLIKDLDRRLGERGGLFGGARELILSPDNEILTFYLSLGSASHNELMQLDPLRKDRRPTQNSRAGREDPEGMVQVVFRHLAAAATEVYGDLPPRWHSYVDGTAPSVAAVRATPIPLPAPETGDTALRLSVRNGHRAYDTLVGMDLLSLSPDDEVALVPRDGETECHWPRALVVRLAQALTPRGLVAPQLSAL